MAARRRRPPNPSNSPSASEEEHEEHHSLATTQADLPKMTRASCKRVATVTGHEIDIELRQAAIDPTCIREVPQGALVIHLENTDPYVAHTFTVPGTKVDVYLTQGQKATTKLEIKGTDQIRFYCKPHAERMYGAFFPRDMN
jgi:hypothetical protein